MTKPLDGTHTIQLIDRSNQHVCISCGGCTCHTPNLLGISCEAASATNTRIFDHKWIAARRTGDIHTDPVTLQDLIVNTVRGEFHDFEDRFKEQSESEKALAKLRRKLSGDPEPVEESEAKFNFELRRTALEWVEKNFSNVISPRTKMGLVQDTENFLRTGSFQENMTSKAVSDLATALVQTRDYVQPMVMLHAAEGWSWYDALKEHAPFILQQALEADARAHARKNAESDENEMEDGDPTTNDQHA